MCKRTSLLFGPQIDRGLRIGCPCLGDLKAVQKRVVDYLSRTCLAVDAGNNCGWYHLLDHERHAADLCDTPDIDPGGEIVWHDMEGVDAGKAIFMPNHVFNAAADSTLLKQDRYIVWVSSEQDVLTYAGHASCC